MRLAVKNLAAPKIAHHRTGSTLEDIPIDQILIGDDILVRAGEVIPVDGIITSRLAMIDEAALTGEPIPVSHQSGELARSGSLNAGDTFEIRASAPASESTYAGIVRMVSAAQTAKSPFTHSRRWRGGRAIRLAAPGRNLICSARIYPRACRSSFKTWGTPWGIRVSNIAHRRKKYVHISAHVSP